MLIQSAYKHVRGRELSLTLNKAGAAIGFLVALVAPDLTTGLRFKLLGLPSTAPLSMSLFAKTEYNEAKAFTNIAINTSGPGFNANTTYVNDRYRGKLEKLLREKGTNHVVTAGARAPLRTCATT